MATPQHPSINPNKAKLTQLQDKCFDSQSEFASLNFSVDTDRGHDAWTAAAEAIDALQEALSLFDQGHQSSALGLADDAILRTQHAVLLAKVCVCEETLSNMAKLGIMIGAARANPVAAEMQNAVAELEHIDDLLDADFDMAWGRICAAYDYCREVRQLAAGHRPIRLPMTQGQAKRTVQ